LKVNEKRLKTEKKKFFKGHVASGFN
jgi:hypothetical protein